MKNRTFALLSLGACLLFAGFDARAQTRILPLGDSVTSSYSPNSSYRYWLWHDLIDAGFSVDFVGTQHGVADGPPGNPDFDQDHEGHPGWATQDVLDNIDSIAAATRPDIVLLDIGANDMEQGVPIATVISNLEAIIGHLRAENPNVVVLLAEPTPYRGPRSGRMGSLRGAVARVARVENQSDSPVIVVNLFGGFNIRRDTYDGVHPNENGEQFIANRFFAALVKVLP